MLEQDRWLVEVACIKQIHEPASHPPADLEADFAWVLSCALN